MVLELKLVANVSGDAFSNTGAAVSLVPPVGATRIAQPAAVSSKHNAVLYFKKVFNGR